jgi:hypothetical protein
LWAFLWEEFMKKIVLTLLLVSLSRTAYAVPTGCFVTTYGTSCYFGYFYSSDCDQVNMTSYNFGYYINSMCDYVNSIESTSAACINTLAAVATQRDTATALVASTEQNRQEWIAYAGTRDKLIKKLYKACGSKCRRLK